MPEKRYYFFVLRALRDCQHRRLKLDHNYFPELISLLSALAAFRIGDQGRDFRFYEAVELRRGSLVLAWD
jgi:hypothetical protein